MNAKHMPGPWRWVADGQPIDIATYKSPGYYANAELQALNGEYIIGCGEYDIVCGSGPAERIANAHLIAAAPDMYAALHSCQQMLSVYNTHDDGTQRKRGPLADLLKLVTAAIAKAEGES